MSLPAAVRPATQEACGGQPRGRSNNPRWARIVNPVLNQSPVIRRKDAERLVSLGRAEWLTSDQLRLLLSHPANRRAASHAAAGYDSAEGKHSRDSLNYIYREKLVNQPYVLKRLVAGTFVRWRGNEGFSLKRFNPDRLGAQFSQAEILLAQQSLESERLPHFAAGTANAPLVPPARFCVKRDPSLPWSAENGREVF